MKLFPSLSLITLCAAFSGCTATTQTLSFVPSAPDQDGVVVSIDGKEVGTTPFTYKVLRTVDPVVFKLDFKKDGFQSEEGVLESVLMSDGMCSFIDEIPVPELLPASDAVVAVAGVPAEPAPAVAAVEEPVAPAPAVVVAEEGPEPVAVVASAEEPAPAPEPEPVVEPEPASADEPAPAAPVAEEEPEPAPEPAPAVADEPAPVPADAAPVVAADDAKPAEPEKAVAAVPALDRNRTLKDIESDLKNYTAQRQSGQITEKEFRELCAELEREVQLRYGKK